MLFDVVVLPVVEVSTAQNTARLCDDSSTYGMYDTPATECTPLSLYVAISFSLSLSLCLSLSLPLSFSVCLSVSSHMKSSSAESPLSGQLEISIRVSLIGSAMCSQGYSGMSSEAWSL